MKVYVTSSVAMATLGTMTSPSTGFVVLPGTSRTAGSNGIRGTPSTGLTYRASPLTSTRRGGRPLRLAAGLSMLVEPKGEDSFKQIEDEVEGDPLKKTAGNMTPAVAKAVLTGVIPVASAVGYLVVPSSKIAVSAIGAALSGVGGAMARKKLLQARKEAAPAQVARLLESKGIGNVTSEEVRETLASFGLEGQDAEDILIEIFSKYAVAMCQHSATKTSEIKELSELRESLGLDGLLMGEALHQAASPIYSQFVAKTLSTELADEWSPNRRSLDKFLFLCDRMFEVCDTEEAYSYEMSRISKIFDLTLSDVKSRCGAIAGPFYEKALNSARAKWDSVKAQQLERARKTLGMDPNVAKDMHRAAYGMEVSSLVKKRSVDGMIKIQPEDKERLGKLAAVFELSEEEAVNYYEAVVTPVFQRMLATCLSRFIEDDSPSELARIYGDIMTFTSSSNLRPQSANNAFSAIVVATVSNMYEVAEQHVRVANEKEASKSTREMLKFAKSAVALTTMKVEEEGTGEDPYLLTFRGPAVRRENRREAPAVFKAFLQSCLTDGQISDEDHKSSSLLGSLLGIGESDQMEVYREVASPRVLRQLTQSVQVGIDTGEWPEEAKAANEKLVEECKIPYVVVADQSKQLYKKTLEVFTEGNRILTVKQKETLDKMAAFLSLDADVIADMHEEMCSEAFRKAVAEAMGPTGVIVPEYREKLDDVAARMGLSAKSAKLAFHAAVRLRMAPLIEQIINEFERSVLTKDQLARKTGKDAGTDFFVESDDSDLGIEGGPAVTSALLSLIDFYVDNKVIETDDEGNETFPVNAAQIGIDTQVLTALYQNFVVAAFGVQGPKLKRYEEGQRKLSGILGISDEEKAKIHEEIGGTVIQRFVNQELGKSGKITTQGLTFLANINTRLAMPSDVFDKMVQKYKAQYLSDKTEGLFRTDKVTAKECKSLRDLAADLGMSLAEEGKLTLAARKAIFQVEAETMIEDGKMEGDAGQEFVEELTDALSLTMEEAQATMLSLLESRAKLILKDVEVATIRENRDDARVLANAERLLKYCRLSGGMAVENDLNSRQRTILLNVYEGRHAGNAEEGEEGEKRKKFAEDLDLLKVAIGMKETA